MGESTTKYPIDMQLPPLIPPNRLLSAKFQICNGTPEEILGEVQRLVALQDPSASRLVIPVSKKKIEMSPSITIDYDHCDYHVRDADTVYTQYAIYSMDSRLGSVGAILVENETARTQCKFSDMTYGYLSPVVIDALICYRHRVVYPAIVDIANTLTTTISSVTASFDVYRCYQAIQQCPSALQYLLEERYGRFATVKTLPSDGSPRDLIVVLEQLDMFFWKPTIRADVFARWTYKFAGGKFTFEKKWTTH